MNYKAFTPTDLPRGVPRYAATVLRDEKGSLYVSPRVANLDDMVAVMATNFDGAPSLSHKGHIYVPASWVQAEYAHCVEGLGELLDAMKRAVTTCFPRWFESCYCLIEDSEWVKTSRGGYLELVLKVIKGDREGLRFIDRLHLNHAGDAALQERSYKRLADYCHLTGQIQIADSNQLHGIPFWVLVEDSGEVTTVRLQDKGQRGDLIHRGEPFTVEVLDD